MYLFVSVLFLKRRYLVNTLLVTAALEFRFKEQVDHIARKSRTDDSSAEAERVRVVVHPCESRAERVRTARGAGVIFGVTGGVMEAALRTVYFKLTGKEHEAIKFEEVRGHEAGIREAAIDINGTTVNVAIASGMKSAKVLLDEIREGKSKYQFIEIMGCPGGCINGGGQPIVRSCFLPNEADDIYDTYKEKRAKALYSEDERQVLRQSHNNPQIIELYEKFLGEPNSHKAHELLHTTYAGREGFNER